MATKCTRGIRRPVLILGEQLRNRYLEATSSQCEPLTFYELEVEDKFIVVPFPGDNDGHDGLRGSFHLFRKTKMRIAKSGDMLNAVRLSDNNSLYCDNNTPVLRVR